MIPGEDVRVDVAGRVVTVEPGRITIEASEGGVLWSVSGLVWDIPTGATIERRETPKTQQERHHRAACRGCWAQAHEGHNVKWWRSGWATCRDCCEDFNREARA